MKKGCLGLIFCVFSFFCYADPFEGQFYVNNNGNLVFQCKNISGKNLSDITIFVADGPGNLKDWKLKKLKKGHEFLVGQKEGLLSSNFPCISVMVDKIMYRWSYNPNIQATTYLPPVLIPDRSDTSVTPYQTPPSANSNKDSHVNVQKLRNDLAFAEQELEFTEKQYQWDLQNGYSVITDSIAVNQARLHVQQCKQRLMDAGVYDF
jgi:hypothetical protein